MKEDYQEIYIGLCNAVDDINENEQIINVLEELLSSIYDYKRITIARNEILANHLNKKANNTPDFELEYLERNYGKDVIAKKSIEAIRRQRKDHFSKGQIRNCYIINQITNEQELALYKKVYGDRFFFLAITQLNKDRKDEYSFHRDQRDFFINADYYIKKTEDDNGLKQKLERFLKLLFGAEIVTPTIHERAMYAAYSASFNSACMSRQVGACVTDKNGNVISVGWNDVPKAGGNVYTADGNLDLRCYAKDGICYKDAENKAITEKIWNLLNDEGVDIGEHEAKIKEIIHKKVVKNLLEFSRSVHAEMHAIIIGAQQEGDKMIGGNLYVTTFPCHNCARHIILAGIKKVYFMEPFNKSKAIELHGDAMTEDENRKDLVSLILYEGVGGTKYKQFFRANISNRKIDGKLIPFDLTYIRNSDFLITTLQTISVNESNLFEVQF